MLYQGTCSIDPLSIWGVLSWCIADVPVAGIVIVGRERGNGAHGTLLKGRAPCRLNLKTYFENIYFAKNAEVSIDRGCGQVVRLFTLYFDEPISNPAEVFNF